MKNPAQTSLVWEPARAPFVEGEVLVVDLPQPDGRRYTQAWVVGSDVTAFGNLENRKLLVSLDEPGRRPQWVHLRHLHREVHPPNA